MASMTYRFDEAFAALPKGASEGLFEGRRWGLTVTSSADGRRHWLYGEELGGHGRVSANLYRVGGALRLKPCEMPAERVRGFVLGYAPLSRTPPSARR